MPVYDPITDVRTVPKAFALNKLKETDSKLSDKGAARELESIQQMLIELGGQVVKAAARMRAAELLDAQASAREPCHQDTTPLASGTPTQVFSFGDVPGAVIASQCGSNPDFLVMTNHSHPEVRCAFFGRN